jgi:hypothetical protein
MDVEVVVVDVVDIVVVVIAGAGPLSPPLDAAALAASRSAFFASFFNSDLDGPVVAEEAVVSSTSSVMLDEKSWAWGARLKAGAGHQQLVNH